MRLPTRSDYPPTVALPRCIKHRRRRSKMGSSPLAAILLAALAAAMPAAQAAAQYYGRNINIVPRLKSSEME